MYIFDTPKSDANLNQRLIDSAARGDMGRYQLYLYLGAEPHAMDGEALKQAAAGGHAEIVEAILWPGNNLRYGGAYRPVLRGVDVIPSAVDTALAHAKIGGEASSEVTKLLLRRSDREKDAGHVDEIFKSMRQMLGARRTQELRSFQLLGRFVYTGVNADLAITHGLVKDTGNPGLNDAFLDHAGDLYGKAFAHTFAARCDLQKKFSRWVMVSLCSADDTHAIHRDEYLSELNRQAKEPFDACIQTGLNVLHYEIGSHRNSSSFKPAVGFMSLDT